MNPLNRHIYGLAQARRARESFKEASNQAKIRFYLWTILSYLADCLLGVIAICLAINGQSPFLSDTVVTIFGTSIAAIKTFESAIQLKSRALTSKIVYKNFSSVVGKIDDAFNVLQSEDGIQTPEKMEIFSKMIRLIEQLVSFASKWASPDEARPESVSDSIYELQKIEREILTQQLSQNQQFRPNFPNGNI